MTEIRMKSLEELVSGEAFKALSQTARAEFGQHQEALGKEFGNGFVG